jgi:RNA polymerase sigma-70 factor (ECF subfamily)
VPTGSLVELSDIDALYRTLGPMVLRRCRRILRNEEEAVDAMHDVFVQVLRHRERLVRRGPSSLLYRIATNICLNRLRSKRRSPEDPNDEILLRIASSDDVEEKAIAGALLDRIFLREKASTRVIATMHYVDGLTLEEVAEETGLSVSGVRKRLRVLRARALHLAGDPGPAER